MVDRKTCWCKIHHGVFITRESFGASARTVSRGFLSLFFIFIEQFFSWPRRYAWKGGFQIFVELCRVDRNLLKKTCRCQTYQRVKAPRLPPPRVDWDTGESFYVCFRECHSLCIKRTVGHLSFLFGKVSLPKEF